MTVQWGPRNPAGDSFAAWASPYSGVRVLHVAEAFGGGLLEMVRMVAEGAAEAGNPHAIAFGRRPETPVDVRGETSPAVGLFELDWGARRPGGELAAVRELRRIAAQWEADVVHLHSSFAGVTGALALGGRVRLIWTPHGFPSQLAGRSAATRGTFHAIERLVAGRVDLIGAVSDSEGLLAEELAPGRVHVIPNGIRELDGDPPARPALQVPRVVAGGRIVGQRRPDACARILGPLAGMADVAWIGGGGAEVGVTEAGSAALKAAGVPVTGWVPRARMLDELQQSTVYLHWTSWDGLPLTVLEAMARDAIVVASDIPPNREILDPRQLCSTEAEARALIRYILEDPDFAAELRAAQAERRWMYSASRMAGAWTRLYAHVAGVPHAGSRPARRRSLTLA